MSTEPEVPLVRELRPRADKLCLSKGWEVIHSLGAGYTAAVYEVKTAQGIRALKLYHPRFLKGKSGDVVKRRFELVRKHLTGHTCPNLVVVHEGGEAEGTLFMLMQRAPGHSLGKMLKLVPRAKIREIVRQVAQAARFLEDRQICHRDIKADNIVVAEDFNKAVLLDLGVVRWLDEEGTAGTDHEGQLPFVATAQYSSPEYMFRLVKPGPELWRGLTFYQLGGLLHDLIMRRRLFEDVVSQGKENRYLIAHAVAATEPLLTPDASVPIDLTLTAQRALTKDLSRRLTLVDWSDFLEENQRRKREIILGLDVEHSTAAAESVVPNLIRGLEIDLDKLLSSRRIHCKHDHEVLSPECGLIKFIWSPQTKTLPANVEVLVILKIVQDGEKLIMDGAAEVSVRDQTLKLADVPVADLPIESGEPCSPALVEHAYDGFIQLSADIVTEYLNWQALDADT